MALILARIVRLRSAPKATVLAAVLLLLTFGSAHAGDTERIYPDLTLDGKTWKYDVAKAVALSDQFLEKVRRLSSYSCRVQTFYSLPRIASSGRARQIKKNPNEEFDLTVFYHPMTIFVRLIHPRKGATVFYRSVDRVTEVRPFSFLPFFIPLSPHSSLITSRYGHTIDHSDFRTFGKRLLRPACLTHSCLYLGMGTYEGHRVDVINVAPDQLESRPIFGRMWLLLDHDTTLPVSIGTYGPKGRFWERVDYKGCHFSYR